MMKIFRSLLIFFLGIFIGGLAINLLPVPYTTIVIINHSSSPVSQVRLDFEDGQIYIVENLQIKKSKTLRMDTEGESSYQIQATLSSGKVLDGGGMYIESGYKVTEIIYDDKIETDFGEEY